MSPQNCAMSTQHPLPPQFPCESAAWLISIRLCLWLTGELESPWASEESLLSQAPNSALPLTSWSCFWDRCAACVHHSEPAGGFWKSFSQWSMETKHSFTGSCCVMFVLDPLGSCVVPSSVNRWENADSSVSSTDTRRTGSLVATLLGHRVHRLSRTPQLFPFETIHVLIVSVSLNCIFFYLWVKAPKAVIYLGDAWCPI